MAYIIVLLDRAGLHTMLPLLLSYFSCFRLFVTLCDSCDYGPPGSPVHGILQAKILEWAAMPSPPGDLPNTRIKPKSLMSPELAGGFKPIYYVKSLNMKTHNLHWKGNRPREVKKLT